MTASYLRRKEDAKFEEASRNWTASDYNAQQGIRQRCKPEVSKVTTLTTRDTCDK